MRVGGACSTNYEMKNAHINLVGISKNAHINLVGISKGSMTLGRRWRRWEDNL
jgi:hypothetical protein